MHSTTTAALLALTIASIAFAQTSTVTLYIPGADTQPLEASIITSDASATTYLLQCIPGTDSDECGLDGAMTLTEGPKTAAYTFGPDIENGTVLFAGYMDCSLDGTTSAVCVESAGGVEANFPGMSTVTYTGTDMPYMPVIVTAQAAGTGGSLPASTTTTSTSKINASTSGAGGKSSATPTTNGGSVATFTTPASSALSSTSSKSTSSSNAGVLAVTGDANWIIGGAVAALAIII